MISKIMEAGMRKSKNPCPACGGHLWRCYWLSWSPLNGSTAEPCSPADKPLVDLTVEDYLITEAFDECVKCGAVVS